MKKNACLLLIIVAFIAVCTSCIKSKEGTPQPSSTINGYRVQAINYYDSTGTTLTGTTTLTYDVKHRCVGTFSTSHSGYMQETETYQYDDNDLITFYSYGGTDDSAAYRFSYTSDQLVSLIQLYNALPATTVYKNTKNFYDSNRNMIYQTVVLADSLHGDSITYNNYTSGRPADAVLYRWSNGAYQTIQKIRYTYDGRMNRIKEESTVVGGDLAVYSDVRQTHFQVMADQTQINTIGGPDNIEEVESGDDMNLYSANTDKDFIVYTSNSSSCGLYDDDTYSIEQSNDAGFPLKYRNVVNQYNCGGPANYRANILTEFVYETF